MLCFQSSFKFWFYVGPEKWSITYLLTAWCRVLLEKLTGLQLVKKFSAFYGTRRFITTLTNFRHLSLSWANPNQFIYPHPTSWRSILILSTHLRLGLPIGSFPPVSPARPNTPPLLTHTRHMPSPSHSSRFYHPHNNGTNLNLIYSYLWTETCNLWVKLPSPIFRFFHQDYLLCITFSLSSSMNGRETFYTFYF